MTRQLHMHKEVTRKEDGRYLIYYHFTAAPDPTAPAPERNSTGDGGREEHV